MERKERIQNSKNIWKLCTCTEFDSPEYYALAEEVLKKILEEFFPNKIKAIDVGCGSGRYTKCIASYCDYIHGFELSKVLVQQAKKEFPLANGEYHQFDLEDKEWDFPHSADAIFCMGVFATIVDYGSLLKILENFYSTLQQNGLLITRDSLTSEKTIEQAHPNGYYSVYRNKNSFLKLMKRKGFHLEKDFPLTQKGTLGNAYYVFRKKNIVP